MSVFGPLIERVYMRRWFNTSETRAVMGQIFRDTRQTFHTMLTTDNDWMDAQTRAEAIRKLEKLTFDIGFLDKVFNDTRLRKQYKEVCLEKNI